MNKTTKFYSNSHMIKYLKRLKRMNPVAKIIGLDIGRVFVGSAISDTYLKTSRAFDGFSLGSGIALKHYPKTAEEFALNYDFFEVLNALIRKYNTKALIVGYPIQNGKPSQHSQFIEQFMKHAYRNDLLHIPTTFVNEEYSTFEASKLIEMYQVDKRNYDKNLVHRKLMKDKFAAKVILDKFLNEYNKEVGENEGEVIDDKEDEFKDNLKNKESVKNSK